MSDVWTPLVITWVNSFGCLMAATGNEWFGFPYPNRGCPDCFWIVWQLKRKWKWTFSAVTSHCAQRACSDSKTQGARGIALLIKRIKRVTSTFWSTENGLEMRRISFEMSKLYIFPYKDGDGRESSQHGRNWQISCAGNGGGKPHRLTLKLTIESRSKIIRSSKSGPVAFPNLKIVEIQNLRNDQPSVH